MEPNECCDVAGISRRLETVEKTLADILAVITIVKEQVEPTINALTKSPIFKMLGVKL